MSKRITVDTSKMPALTLEQAKALRHGQIVYHRINRNSDGTAQRWRVSSVVKTWKRDATRVSVAVKHGLYANDRISENDLDLVSLCDGQD